jgi:sarcosine oxidase, subunit gamma
MLENRSAARRKGVLDQLDPLPASNDIVVRALQPDARFALRLSADDAVRVGAIAGLTLTQPINHFSESPPRLGARLGPDEWLLITTEADAEAFPADAARALADCHHALVDISHRNIGIEVSGPAAAEILNTGCPLDLDSHRFVPGAATRTLLAKAEIVLLRLADIAGGDGRLVARYRIECWRSFGRYVHGVLAEAARKYTAA